MVAVLFAIVNSGRYYCGIVGLPCRPSDRVRLKNANYAKFSGEIVRLESTIAR